MGDSEERPDTHWRNWSGRVRSRPRRRLAPDGESEVCAAVQAHPGGPVRVAGAGHSFTPLVSADGGLLLSLERLSAVIEVDPDAHTALIAAGTPLSALGEPLLAAGMALANMGDIDRQALAGAVSTGTHGTGARLGSLSTQVRGLRLLCGTGEVIDCDADSDAALFNAARVGLGVMGVLLRVRLQCVPAYRLHERSEVLGFEQCMDGLAARVSDNRHFEFFWLPGEDLCACKYLNPIAADFVPAPDPGPPPPAAAARYAGPARVDHAHRIFPSARDRRFNEQEYALPAADGPECLRELRALMRSRHRDVSWAVEYRTLAADDIWLSPAHGRETVTVSVHQGAQLPCDGFFADTEAIFRNHRGRPHWGKLHGLRAAQLEALYPRWGDFLATRERLDPQGRFLNPYLRDLLGV